MGGSLDHGIATRSRRAVPKLRVMSIRMQVAIILACIAGSGTAEAVVVATTG
jgi:hypothetical protein